MGSCVSFSRSPPASAAEELQLQQPQRAAAATAKVVSLDGSMALFAAPVTAREALAPAAPSSPPLFLCGADELGFDAPARALAGNEALQPGQLYFALPAPMLRRLLSGKDMAALAVKAATALAAEAGLAAGRFSPRRGSKKGAAAGTQRRRRRQSTARVAPALEVVSKESPPDGAWKNDVHGRHTAVQDGDCTAAAKTRKGAAGYRSGSRHRRAVVQRLSAIAEDGE